MIKYNSDKWRKVVEFHGHACPGIAYGVRASEIALNILGVERAKDEELIAIVETDSCSVDAIQVLTGCTFGKGNLIFKDVGKSAFTFVNRKTKEAVRIIMKPNKSKSDNELRKKVMSGTATKEEIKLFSKLQEEKIKFILEGPQEKVCKVQQVNIKIPEKARIFNSVKCEKCGEYFMEARARLENGKIVCLDCFNDYSRKI